MQALAALHHHFKVVPAKALLVGFHPDVRLHHRGAGNIFHIVVFKHITQAEDGQPSFGPNTSLIGMVQIVSRMNYSSFQEEKVNRAIVAYFAGL